MIEKINELIIETTKKRETKLLEVYKLVKSEFQKAEKSGKKWDPVTILLKMISSRKDSVAQYQKAERQDLVDQENYEIQVIQDLLPPMPSEDEMRSGVKELIESLSQPVGMKDTKFILETLSPKFPGLSGKLVSEIIKSYVDRT